MFDWLYEYLSYGWWVKLPLIFSVMCVFTISVYAIAVNFMDWLVAIHLYNKNGWFQLSYPNFKDKIVKIKYTHYIINRGTGEIFYIEYKSLKKLKNKELIFWNEELSNYVFLNDNLTQIKDIIKPIIVIWDKNITQDEI